MESLIVAYAKKEETHVLTRRLPDFLIIGAMKCATSSLHEQLARCPGIFMSEPKEPNYFSDPEQWRRGLDWYAHLFEKASRAEICGESSTHYTKLPTYPDTVDRIKRTLPDVKLIYVMRHPVDRLISQYMHEWTTRELDGSINDAIKKYPRLVDYSCYASQLMPYLENFSRRRILLMFFERITQDPNRELGRVFQFLGYDGMPNWQIGDVRNRSSDRMRKNFIRDLIVENSVSSCLRKNLINFIVPKEFRNRVKKLWQIQSRPTLDNAVEVKLKETLNEDLGLLGQWLGVSINCSSYHKVSKQHSADWAA